MAKPVASARSNPKYASFMKSNHITIERRQMITGDEKIFAIGSCFAEEIRKALSRIGFDILPKYRSLVINKDDARADELPRREHLNYYNAFTINQEFERINGLWTQTENDYWEVKNDLWPGQTAYQDPYRRLVFGRTPEILANVTSDLNSMMKDGFADATVFLMTFGMTEVFVNKLSKKIVAQKPLYYGGGGEIESDLLLSSFQENLEAIRSTINLINRSKPTAKIFVTVSPVPLERTFSGKDIYVANMESKSVLRSVLGQVSREFENVTYFPAYETVMSGGQDSFEHDGRHVKPEVVAMIMDAFIDSYVIK